MPKPLRKQPKVVLGLALALVLAHVARLFLAPADEAGLTLALAVIPGRYDPGIDAYPSLAAAVAPLVLHVFLHAGWLHLVMNLIVFLSAADLVADRMEAQEPGGVRFLALFFGSAIGGAATYIWFNPHAMIPAVGASGAICGLFAAYLMAMRADWRAAVRDPEVRRAAFWFLAINVGLAAAARYGGVLPIAWEAHLGGFIAGALLFPLLAPRRSAAPAEPRDA
ncbi:MAG: rhomboid family intramembrane serine protease [Alphaproteobacteria bacterium]|nr:rhomboid family intramembrane serine protease [Alphaproteobacteria bacterium]